MLGTLGDCGARTGKQQHTRRIRLTASLSVLKGAAQRDLRDPEGGGFAQREGLKEDVSPAPAGVHIEHDQGDVEIVVYNRAILLFSARKALGVQVRREGFGKDGRFLLALPSNGTDPADGATRTNSDGKGNGFDHEHMGQSVPSGLPVS